MPASHNDGTFQATPISYKLTFSFTDNFNNGTGFA